MRSEAPQSNWLQSLWEEVPALREDELAELVDQISQASHNLTALERRLNRFTDPASREEGLEIINQMRERLSELEAKRDQLQGLVDSK